ncbi:hypothetical protein EAO68_01120, partial [Streptomyces sp. wa22]
LRPAHGEVVEAVWCDAGPRARGRLLLVVHHLAVDAVSWRILATDVAAAWQAVTEAPDATGRAALPAPTTSYRQWARQWARLLATQAHEPSRESGQQRQGVERHVDGGNHVGRQDRGQPAAHPTGKRPVRRLHLRAAHPRRPHRRRLLRARR